MSYILEVNTLSKSYKDFSSEIKRIFSWFSSRFKPTVEHNILNNISFTLSKGEAVGIIGQNGAGKSTLLKIITGTLRPTLGSVVIHGRVSAILELGMGFHPELTGRQNVYHAGGLLGFSTNELDAVIDEIEDFAEIGEYFDQPVRVYSSGMQMRVAFGVATAYRPEILIVDEALSVGDAYFQHKSFARIRKFQEQGTSLLLVSHDKAAIQAICNRAILLEKGVILKDGAPEEIMDYYNGLVAEKEGNATVKQVVNEQGRIETISGTGEASLQDVVLLDERGMEVEVIGVGDTVTISATVAVHEDLERLVLGYGIKDRLGQVLYGTNTWYTNQVIDNPIRGGIYRFNITFTADIGIGSYSVQTALVDSHTHMTRNYEWRDLAITFDVVNVNKTYFIGTSWLEPEIEIEQL
jgi:lipopolysaccharide transport system ATP-binding protein